MILSLEQPQIFKKRSVVKLAAQYFGQVGSQLTSRMSAPQAKDGSLARQWGQSETMTLRLQFCFPLLCQKRSSGNGGVNVTKRKLKSKVNKELMTYYLGIQYQLWTLALTYHIFLW